MTFNQQVGALLALVLMCLSACSAPATDAGVPDQPDETITTNHAPSPNDVLAIPDLSGVTVAGGEALRVVATTSIIGDVVRNVAGNNVELTVLMANGQDPHSYQPTPAQLTRASNAHIVFVNGWGLEEGLVADLEGAIEQGVIVPISAGITPLRSNDGAHEHAEVAVTASAEAEPDGDHTVDPHVWFDTRHVARWATNVSTALSAIQPENAATYQANAQTYQARLALLDQEITTHLGAIPAGSRKLVTNHDTFQYFAAAYGFEVIGTILPGVSTGTEPSSADLAALIDNVTRAGVQAVFIENVVGEGLASVLTEETGVRIYALYTDALGPEESEAGTYIGMMQANVETLVEALTPVK